MKRSMRHQARQNMNMFAKPIVNHHLAPVWNSAPPKDGFTTLCRVIIGRGAENVLNSVTIHPPGGARAIDFTPDIIQHLPTAVAMRAVDGCKPGSFGVGEAEFTAQEMLDLRAIIAAHRAPKIHRPASRRW